MLHAGRVYSYMCHFQNWTVARRGMIKTYKPKTYSQKYNTTISNRPLICRFPRMNGLWNAFVPLVTKSVRETVSWRKRTSTGEELRTDLLEVEGFAVMSCLLWCTWSSDIICGVRFVWEYLKCIIFRGHGSKGMLLYDHDCPRECSSRYDLGTGHYRIIPR